MDSGWIYAITRSGVLNAFTVDGTGTSTWTREVRPNTSGIAPPLPIAVGGKVFIQDDALLTVVCLDGASGELLWQGDAQVAGMVWSSPVLVDQVLYIAADMGGAYAFDAEGAEGAWYMMKQNPSLTSSNTGWGPVTFTGKPISGETPLTVKFQDKTPGSVTSRTWDFGDGGTSTQKNPNHTYQTAGTYAVTLRVEGPGGGDALTRNDFITVTASTKGALTVTLTPQEAVTAGARWRVDGGSWMSSGQTMTGLAKGKHTVEFLQVEGWTTPKSQTVTITPNKTAKATGVYKSSLPSVSIQAVQETVPETGKSAGAFKVTRTGNTQKSLVVYYSIGGTAKNGRDYKKLTGKVTIPAKKAFATILVRPIDNKTDGTDKTVVLTLKENKSYQVGTPSSATITIADNEA
jgi:PKD repeat protein